MKLMKVPCKSWINNKCSGLIVISGDAPHHGHHMPQVTDCWPGRRLTPSLLSRGCTGKAIERSGLFEVSV